MRTLINGIKRVILEQRIAALQDDITMAQERRESAVRTVAAANQFVAAAHARLRFMRSQLALLQSRHIEAEDALQGRVER